MMDDIKLVSIDELVKEIESRCDEFVCAFTPNDFKVKGESKFFYGKGSWFKSVSLASILKNDVINNWNNELKTLQRINIDE